MFRPSCSFLFLFLTALTTTNAQTTCSPTGFSDQAIDALLDQAIAAGTAVAESAIAAVESGNVPSGIISTATGSLTVISIDDFCIMQPIGGVDVYFQGAVTIHTQQPRAIDGSLSVLNVFDIGPYFHVTGSSISVIGLSVANLRDGSAALTLTGEFCAGSATNCPNDNNAVSLTTISGSVVLHHDENEDIATGTVPVASVGALAYLLIDAAVDTSTAQSVQDFLGRAGEIYIADATLEVKRISSTGEIVPKLFPGSPTFPELTENEENSCQLSSFVPMTCGVIVLRAFVNNGASCSLTTEESTSTKTFECNDGDSSGELRNEISFSWGDNAATTTREGFFSQTGHFFSLADLFHVSNSSIHFSTNNQGNHLPYTHGIARSSLIHGDFCIGSSSNCADPAGFADRVTSGSLDFTHTPTTDSAVGTIPSLTLSGLVYPIIDAMFPGDNHAETFMTFLGPLKDAGINDAAFGFTHANGKISPVISGTPFLPDLTQYTAGDGVETPDVCALSSFKPLDCALRHIKLEMDVSSTDSNGVTTELSITAESPDTSDNVDSATITMELIQGDKSISLTWSKNNGGSSCTGTVSINGKLIDVGYLHMNDAHVSILTESGSGFDGEIGGSFCVGQDQYCDDETDTEHSVRGDMTITHEGGDTDRDIGVGTSAYIKVGAFITAQLSHSTALRDAALSEAEIPQIIRDFAIENAVVEVKRTQSEYSFEVSGQPTFDSTDDTTSLCLDSETDGPKKMVKCSLADSLDDCGDGCPSLSMKLSVSGIGLTGYKTGFDVGIHLPPISIGKVTLEDENGRGPGLTLGLSTEYGVSTQFAANLAVKVQDPSRICPSTQIEGTPDLTCPVYFKGEVAIASGLALPSSPFLSGSLAMYGTWTGMFGVPFLHASDLKIGFRMLPVMPPTPNALEIAGEICIGSETACYSSTVTPASERSPMTLPAIPASEPVLSGDIINLQSQPSDEYCLLTEAQRTIFVPAVRGITMGTVGQITVVPCPLTHDQTLCTEIITPESTSILPCKAWCHTNPNHRTIDVPAVSHLVDDDTPQCTNGEVNAAGDGCDDTSATFSTALQRGACKTKTRGTGSTCEEWRKKSVELNAATTRVLDCGEAPVAWPVSPSWEALPEEEASTDQLTAANAHNALVVQQEEEARLAFVAANPKCIGGVAFPCGHFIKARTHVVFDSINPINNFIVVYLSETTLETIFYIIYENQMFETMFGESSDQFNPDLTDRHGNAVEPSLVNKLPATLKGSGIFPFEKTININNGGDVECSSITLLNVEEHRSCFARFSYSPMRSNTMPTSSGDIIVPQGLEISARLNLFGWEVAVEMVISKRGFHLHGICDPINIPFPEAVSELGTLLEMRHSSDNQDEGPSLVLDMDVANNLQQIQVDAYIAIPLISLSAEAHIFIDDEQFAVSVAANLFGLVCFEVDVKAPATTFLPMTIHAAFSTQCPQSQTSGDAVATIVSGVAEAVGVVLDNIFGKIDEIFNKIQEWTDKVANICNEIFPLDRDNTMLEELNEHCRTLQKSDFGVAALSLFNKVFAWVRNKVQEVKTYINTKLGLISDTDASPNPPYCTPDQANEETDPNVCTIPTDPQPNENAAPDVDGSIFKLINAQLDATITEDIVGSRVSGEVTVEFFGEEMHLDIPPIVLEDIINEIIAKATELGLAHLTAIYDDVTGFLSEAVNAIEDKWTAFKRELEPGSLAAKGEEIMNSMKELVGLDVARAAFTLSVSGDGNHFWAFDADGRVVYRKGKEGSSWEDVSGPDSILIPGLALSGSEEKINSISVNEDGSKVFAVTDGGHTKFRAGYRCADGNLCPWYQLDSAWWGTDDMRNCHVSGDGQKLFTIEDAMGAGGADSTGWFEGSLSDGGDIKTRIGLNDLPANSEDSSLWEEDDWSGQGAILVATTFNANMVYAVAADGWLYKKTLGAQSWTQIESRSYSELGNFVQLSSSSSTTKSKAIMKVAATKIATKVDKSKKQRKWTKSPAKHPVEPASITADDEKRKRAIEARSTVMLEAGKALAKIRTTKNKLLNHLKVEVAQSKNAVKELESNKHDAFLRENQRAAKKIRRSTFDKFKEVEDERNEDSDSDDLLIEVQKQATNNGLKAKIKKSKLRLGDKVKWGSSSRRRRRWFAAIVAAVAPTTYNPIGGGCALLDECASPGVCSGVPSYDCLNPAGSLTPGTTCHSNSECSHSSCLDNLCTGWCGHCADRNVENGNSCSRDAECTSAICEGPNLLSTDLTRDRDTGNCVSGVGALGDFCLFDDSCVSATCDTLMCIHVPESQPPAAACRFDSECSHSSCLDNTLPGWSGHCAYRNLPGAAQCSRDAECSWGKCMGNGLNNIDLTRGQGEGTCSDGSPGSECNEDNNCATGIFNGLETTGRCDSGGGVTDSGTCLYQIGSLAGGSACTLDDECQWHHCDGNNGGVTWNAGTGTCSNGRPGSSCSDNGDCATNLCDDDGVVTSSSCLYPEKSRHYNQHCTLNIECASDICEGNSFGVTTDWNTGSCTGAVTSVSVEGDGGYVYAVEAGGDIIYMDASSDTGGNNWELLDPPSTAYTNQEGETHWEVEPEHSFHQVIANNANPTKENSEIWGVTKAGEILYRRNHITDWIPFDQAPVCTCTGGVPSVGSDCFNSGSNILEWTTPGKGEKCVSCDDGLILDVDQTKPANPGFFPKTFFHCLPDPARAPKFENNLQYYKMKATWSNDPLNVNSKAWTDRDYTLSNLEDMTVEAWDYMISTSVSHKSDNIIIEETPIRSKFVVLRKSTFQGNHQDGWVLCTHSIQAKISGTNKDWNWCSTKIVEAGSSNEIVNGGSSAAIIFIKIMD